MNRRYLLAAGLLAFLIASAGCTGVFGGQNPVPKQQLDAAPSQPYNWTSNASAYILVTQHSKFEVVYDLNAAKLQNGTIKFSRQDTFGGQNPLNVQMVRYRYPNGTVINGSQFSDHGGSVTQSRDAVSVTIPSDHPKGKPGQLAFTSDTSPKRFSLPTFVKGSYEVVLPPDRRVNLPIISSIQPSGYTVSSPDDQGRTHIYWKKVSADNVSVQYYLQRDVYLLGGGLAIFAVLGLAGALYYQRQIDALRDQRQNLGLDVERNDDDE